MSTSAGTLMKRVSLYAWLMTGKSGGIDENSIHTKKKGRN